MYSQIVTIGIITLIVWLLLLYTKKEALNGTKITVTHSNFSQDMITSATKGSPLYRHCTDSDENCEPDINGYIHCGDCASALGLCFTDDYAFSSDLCQAYCDLGKFNKVDCDNKKTTYCSNPNSWYVKYDDICYADRQKYPLANVCKGQLLLYTNTCKEYCKTNNCPDLENLCKDEFNYTSSQVCKDYCAKNPGKCYQPSCGKWFEFDTQECKKLCQENPTLCNQQKLDACSGYYPLDVENCRNFCTDSSLCDDKLLPLCIEYNWTKNPFAVPVCEAYCMRNVHHTLCDERLLSQCFISTDRWNDPRCKAYCEKNDCEAVKRDPTIINKYCNGESLESQGCKELCQNADCREKLTSYCSGQKLAEIKLNGQSSVCIDFCKENEAICKETKINWCKGVNIDKEDNPVEWWRDSCLDFMLEERNQEWVKEKCRTTSFRDKWGNNFNVPICEEMFCDKSSPQYDKEFCRDRLSSYCTNPDNPEFKSKVCVDWRTANAEDINKKTAEYCSQWGGGGGPLLYTSDYCAEWCKNNPKECETVKAGVFAVECNTTDARSFAKPTCIDYCKNYPDKCKSILDGFCRGMRFHDYIICQNHCSSFPDKEPCATNLQEFCFTNYDGVDYKYINTPLCQNFCDKTDKCIDVIKARCNKWNIDNNKAFCEPLCKIKPAICEQIIQDFYKGNCTGLSSDDKGCVDYCAKNKQVCNENLNKYLNTHCDGYSIYTDENCKNFCEKNKQTCDNKIVEFCQESPDFIVKVINTLDKSCYVKDVTKGVETQPTIRVKKNANTFKLSENENILTITLKPGRYKRGIFADKLKESLNATSSKYTFDITYPMNLLDPEANKYTFTAYEKGSTTKASGNIAFIFETGLYDVMGFMPNTTYTFPETKSIKSVNNIKYTDDKLYFPKLIRDCLPDGDIKNQYKNSLLGVCDEDEKTKGFLSKTFCSIDNNKNLDICSSPNKFRDFCEDLTDRFKVCVSSNGECYYDDKIETCQKAVTAGLVAAVGGAGANTPKNQTPGTSSSMIIIGVVALFIVLVIIGVILYFVMKN